MSWYVLALASLSSIAASPQQIDTLLRNSHRSEQVNAGPVCDDATFLRRVSLDLIGRIPTTEELDAFIAAPDRKAKIDDLLQHPKFARRFAEVWTASLVGFTRETPADREVLRQWIERQVAAQKSFKQIARSMISSEGESAVDGPVNFVVRHGEDAGVQVCRQFLGIRLDCARCHDHPFAKWTQDDFAAMSRFFESLRFEEVTEGNIRVRNQPMRVVDEERPRFLSGAQPRTSQWRDELALFVTLSKPFARNFVNRVWYDLMGRGIVDPPDDFNTENEPASRELLELLANDARQHDFDIRRTYRLICNSQAYQRSSSGEATAAERRTFARRVVKPLTPEQIYDSQLVVLGQRARRSEFLRRYRGEAFDEDFLRTWRFRETIQTMLQQVTQDLDVELEISSTRAAYRIVLSRDPTSSEIELCRDHSPQAVVFALLQSNEFVFNH